MQNLYYRVYEKRMQQIDPPCAFGNVQKNFIFLYVQALNDDKYTDGKETNRQAEVSEGSAAVKYYP